MQPLKLECATTPLTKSVCSALGCTSVESTRLEKEKIKNEPVVSCDAKLHHSKTLEQSPPTINERCHHPAVQGCYSTLPATTLWANDMMATNKYHPEVQTKFVFSPTRNLARHKVRPSNKKLNTMTKTESCQRKTKENMDLWLLFKNQGTIGDPQKNSFRSLCHWSYQRENSFCKWNLKLLILIGLDSSRMRPIHSIFDTGAGKTLLDEEKVKFYCMSSVRASKKPQLWSAIKQNARVVGTIMLQEQMKEALKRDMLGLSRI